MPRPESSKLRPATKILNKTGAIDVLPQDEEQSLVTGEYTKFTEFLAYVRTSRIDTAGELHITIAIPYEHKYDAMPLTDMRGVMFIMQAHRPMTEREKEFRETNEILAKGIGKEDLFELDGEGWDNGEDG